MLREKGHNKWLLSEAWECCLCSTCCPGWTGTWEGLAEVWAVVSGWALQDACTWCPFQGCCWKMGLVPAENKVEGDMTDKGLGNLRKLSCQMIAPPCLKEEGREKAAETTSFRRIMEQAELEGTHRIISPSPVPAQTPHQFHPVHP